MGRKWIAAALLAAWMGLVGGSDLTAQQPDAPTLEQNVPAGIRLLYGPSFALPMLDSTADDPFESTGDFRLGLGVRAGIGYRYDIFEVNATADYSGIEVGEPFERDGIPQGRRTSIARAYGLEGRVSPGRWQLARWYPTFSIGYVWGGVDNLLVRPSQLPAELAELAMTIQNDDDDRPTGVSGEGFRLGIAAERAFGSTLAARVQAETDLFTYDEFLFGNERWEREMGKGVVPKLLVLLRWAP